MALTEKYEYSTQVTERDHVQVRERRIILDDGIEISSSNRRWVVSPGQDYSGESGKVRRIAASAHVPTAVGRQAALEKRQLAQVDRDEAKEARKRNDTPETEAAEAAAEAALLQAEAEEEAAEAAHEAFLESEDQ